MATAETQKILDLLNDGRINAEQALNLLNAIQPAAEQDDSPEPRATSQVAEFPQIPASPSENAGAYGDSQIPQKWQRFWVFPLLAGLIISLLSGALWYGIQTYLPEYRTLLVCAIPLFSLGILATLFALLSSNACWLHLRVQNPPGENPQRIAISFPIPFGMIGLFLQLFSRHIDSLQAMPFESLKTAHMLKNFKQYVSPQNPLYIEAHEDDGEHVMIWIG